jgi:hypothetical protein
MTINLCHLTHHELILILEKQKKQKTKNIMDKTFESSEAVLLMADRKQREREEPEAQ